MKVLQLQRQTSSLEAGVKAAGLKQSESMAKLNRRVLASETRLEYVEMSQADVEQTAHNTSISLAEIWKNITRYSD